MGGSTAGLSLTRFGSFHFCLDAKSGAKKVKDGAIAPRARPACAQQPVIAG
jgi:hypothetical protein